MCLGIPGKVIEIDNSNALLTQAKVAFGSISKSVSLCFTPDAKVGDYVVVHVGFAISIINEEQANELMHALAQLGETDEISN
ncbi:MAG: HypC/HybG/HupF family hydrogenase formation chaperone [Proteobacteria bacterium]|nr:HypC/HybG/HupF family hydrogenase formation chaperone [Pseudomonadota bacterium]